MLFIKSRLENNGRVKPSLIDLEARWGDKAEEYLYGGIGKRRVAEMHAHGRYGDYGSRISQMLNHADLGSSPNTNTHRERLSEKARKGCDSPNMRNK